MNKIISKYTSLLKKHSYECAIFPLRNNFKIGDSVLVDGNVGTITDFVNNGTLFIITKDNVGRNYSLNFVKTEKKSVEKYIYEKELLKNHQVEIESLKTLDYMPNEVNGFKNKTLEPTRYGDWERKGKVSDF